MGRFRPGTYNMVGFPSGGLPARRTATLDHASQTGVGRPLLHVDTGADGEIQTVCPVCIQTRSARNDHGLIYRLQDTYACPLMTAPLSALFGRWTTGRSGFHLPVCRGELAVRMDNLHLRHVSVRREGRAAAGVGIRPTKGAMFMAHRVGYLSIIMAARAISDPMGVYTDPQGIHAHGACAMAGLPANMMKRCSDVGSVPHGVDGAGTFAQPREGIPPSLSRMWLRKENTEWSCSRLHWREFPSVGDTSPLLEAENELATSTLDVEPPAPPRINCMVTVSGIAVIFMGAQLLSLSCATGGCVSSDDCFVGVIIGYWNAEFGGLDRPTLSMVGIPMRLLAATAAFLLNGNDLRRWLPRDVTWVLGPICSMHAFVSMPIAGGPKSPWPESGGPSSLNRSHRPASSTLVHEDSDENTRAPVDRFPPPQQMFGRAGIYPKKGPRSWRMW